MRIKAHFATTAALAAATALAVAGSAAGRASDAIADAHERAVQSDPAAAIEYFRANEQATMPRTSGVGVLAGYVDAAGRSIAQSPAEAAVAYFRANEQATMPASGSESLRAYVDGVGRVEVAQPSSSSTESFVTGDSFDWGTAALGASSALLLAVLLGGSLLAVRHSHGRPRLH